MKGVRNFGGGAEGGDAGVAADGGAIFGYAKRARSGLQQTLRGWVGLVRSGWSGCRSWHGWLLGCGWVGLTVLYIGPVRSGWSTSPDWTPGLVVWFGLGCWSGWVGQLETVLVLVRLVGPVLYRSGPVHYMSPVRSGCCPVWRR